MEASKSRPIRTLALAATAAATLSIGIWLAYGAWGPSEQSQDSAGVLADNLVTVSPPVAAPVDPKDAFLGTDSSISPDPLALVLVATVPGKTARDGTASLGTDPRNPQTYAAGATLVNGALLEEVHRDHVVLELDGKRTSLFIGGKVRGRSDSSALTVGGAEVVKRPLDTVPTSREDMSDIIRPEPFYERDEVAGIRLRPGRSSGRFQSLGLQADDIVRSVEGKPVRSVDAAWQKIDDALSTGSSIVVSIERDGTLTSVYLDGAKLAQDAVQVSAMPMPMTPPGT